MTATWTVKPIWRGDYCSDDFQAQAGGLRYTDLKVGRLYEKILGPDTTYLVLKKQKRPCSIWADVEWVDGNGNIGRAVLSINEKTYWQEVHEKVEAP